MHAPDLSLLEFCKRIIGVEGLSGSEKPVADLIAEEMQRVGFDEVIRDGYGTIIGKVRGNRPGNLMFEGHMDTVGIQDRASWKYDPFGSDFVDGKLYGRGTSDMRCALAAMVHAIGSLAKEGNRNHATLSVVAVVHEEIFEGIAFGKVLDRYAPDLVVLGEASDLKLMLGQKGRAELSIETFGKNAHSAHPEKGKNAIEAMEKVLHCLPLMPTPTCPLLGEGIMVVTDILSHPYPGCSVIPDLCTITIDRRTLVGETEQSLVSGIREQLLQVFPQGEHEFACSVKTSRETCYTGASLGGRRFFPAWVIDEGSPFVAFGREAMRQAGLPYATGYYPFCTDGSESAGNRSIPTIGFGPSSPTMAHVIDEYVKFEQVLVAKRVYAELARVFQQLP
ncbi:YgeY family selenium metabolism-linked hydrolase [Sphaerochaeta sp. PS]|uniref:YgeY family selenium metabolism-linked hydrolase n=1 Tax=Sphaerochaeta sp. PS TaxID=3076336 RepID=UPI0028A4EC5F|nr:YgeY family selenium metabolism-linked hydrolase [Sphaerochaeta sp. PS]MDT4761620.1 YgeY family selenium metabolism-linked hydrolase [Sphaerochaeta sp. PS]